MNWLIAHEDRDVSCGYVPVLRHPLIQSGEEEQVNVYEEEKELRVGEMEDQCSLDGLCHRGQHTTFLTVFS